jgi:hypothetical protein
LISDGNASDRYFRSCLAANVADTNTGQIRCLFMQPIRFELIIDRNMDTRTPQEQCAFVF